MDKFVHMSSKIRVFCRKMNKLPHIFVIDYQHNIVEDKLDKLRDIS